MPRATLTMALDRYDRHLPLFEGRIPPPDGFHIDVLEVAQEGELRHGRHRHERMLRDREFDIAELSLSSYLMAKSRGLPFTAIPVFPRRLFSQTQMFVRADSAIEHPSELAGKRVGLQSFQTTLAVLTKGDLAREYGVSLDSITWCVKDPETVPLPENIGARILRVPSETNLADLLAAGEVDALFFSRVPRSLRVEPKAIRRLFRDPRDEALRYFRKNGWFPIMHVIALKQDLAETYPAIPVALVGTFAASFRACAASYDDPAWTHLPFGRLSYEDVADQFASDPWPFGLAANRDFLARFVEYSCEQNLIPRKLPVEELFFPAAARGDLNDRSQDVSAL